MEIYLCHRYSSTLMHFHSLHIKFMVIQIPFVSRAWVRLKDLRWTRQEMVSQRTPACLENTDALCLSCLSALMKGEVNPCVGEGGHVFTFSQGIQRITQCMLYVSFCPLITTQVETKTNVTWSAGLFCRVGSGEVLKCWLVFINQIIVIVVNQKMRIVRWQRDRSS